MLTVGETIREVRQAAGLRLRDLSEKSGVSVPYLSDVERGITQPSLKMLGRLAGALGVSPAALLDRAWAVPTVDREWVLELVFRDGERKSITFYGDAKEPERVRAAVQALEPGIVSHHRILRVVEEAEVAP